MIFSDDLIIGKLHHTSIFKSFPNNKFQTLPNSKSILLCLPNVVTDCYYTESGLNNHQMTILNLMNILESSPKG